MTTTILVTGAGSGGGNNLISSLRSGLDTVRIIGTNMDAWVIRKSTADQDYQIPSASDPGYLDALQQVIAEEKVDLVIANNDREVNMLSRHRAALLCPVFLPPHEIVSLCQDKGEFHRFCDAQDIPVARSVSLRCLEDIPPALERIGGEKFWCRMRRGSGSMGSLPVANADQATAWIRYWERMRGFDVTDFMLAEFLPGRDFAFQSVWKDGELLIGKACERLRYFFARNMPSGSSSTPEVARIVDEDRINQVCIDAIQKIAPEPHGNFCIDLRENAAGEPCITEVNIGRFCMITPIFDRSGDHNTAAIHVAAALDLDLELPPPHERLYDGNPETVMIRDLDTEPKITNVSEFSYRAIGV